MITKVLIIIIGVWFLIIAGFLIALLICDKRIKNCEKHLRELDDISWHLEHGTPVEEILKMPMPKELRKEYLKIHQHYQNEILQIQEKYENGNSNTATVSRILKENKGE